MCFKIYKLNYLLFLWGSCVFNRNMFKVYVSKWTPPLESTDLKSAPFNGNLWMESIAPIIYRTQPQRDPDTHVNLEWTVLSDPLIYSFLYLGVLSVFCSVCMHISTDEVAALSLVPGLSQCQCIAQVPILHSLSQQHLHSYKSIKTS